MGNKSSSSLTTVHDILSARKKNKSADAQSSDASAGEDASRMVDDIAECIDSYSGDYAKLNSKDIKLLASIAALLAEEFCGSQPHSSSANQLPGRLKAIAAVHKLLQIPFVSKNALENCLLGLVNCLGTSNAQSLCLALNCICAGVVSANEDALKCSICLQLESLSFYEIMLKNLDFFFKHSTAERSEESQYLLYAILIFSQHLVWVLGQQLSMSASVALSTTFKSFQKRLAIQISKHLDSIFELTRHDDDAIRFASTMLLIQILSVLERRQCSNIQESARNRGLLLWTLQRLAEHSVVTKSSEINHLPSSLQCSVDNTVSCSISVTAADIRHAQDATRRPSWIQPPVAEGITLEICGAELITAESSLSSVRLLLSQLCFGNKINEEAVFRVLPESFSSFLSLHPSHDTTITDDDNTAPVTNGIKTSTPKFFETMKVTPRFKNMFRQYSSASVGAQSVDSTMQSSVTSTGGVEDLGPLNPGAYRASILNNGGSEVRVSFAAKMGVHDRGSWHVLFAVLCEDFESPKMVWNFSTLQHLTECLTAASKELDAERSICYKPWDIRSIDVRYPLYSTRQYLSVRGVFLPQLIEQLKQDGRTFFIDDPHGTLWALLDRATVEAERVHSALMRTYAPDVTHENAVTSESLEDNVTAEDLAIYLEAILLLLARYHPELHRVTPIYALCGILNKGVELISRLFSISQQVDEKIKDHFVQWMSTTLSILQCRLSGPISRDDWYDFASAGGGNALCVILTSHSLGVRQSDRLREGDGKKELLILSAQLLQNLVISGSQYAMVFACPSGLDLLSKALRLQSQLLDDHVVSGIEAMKGGSEGGEGFVKESHSAKDTGAVSSALSSLISVTQRVFNSLQGRFHGMSCIPQSEVLLLYVDRQMLLIRVLLAAAINPINGAPESSQKARGASPCNTNSSSSSSRSGSGRSSSGSLSYPSAKLLKDLLLLLDSNIADAHTHALCTSSSSTFSSISSPSSSDSISDRLQLMVDTLHCSVPRQLLVLCRRLTSTDFVTTFNTQCEIFSPEIIWCPVLRLRCLESILEDLNDWSVRGLTTKNPYPPPLSHSAEIHAVAIRNDALSFAVHRFPSLENEAQVCNVYLRGFITCRMEDFLVPLQAALFAQALNKKMLKALDTSNYCDITLLYLCLGRLVQLWSPELPLDLWCNTLAPTLLHVLEACADDLRKAPSTSPVPLLKCCSSCIITVGNYLRANISLLDKADKGKAPTLAPTSSNGAPLRPVGASFAELLEAAGPVLSSVVYQCTRILNARSLAHVSGKEDGSTVVFDGSTVCEVTVRTLEATTALLASISLLLGEEAHIERVRVREFVSSQEETPSGAVTPSASAATLGAVTPVGSGSKVPSPTVSSPDLEANQHLAAVQSKLLSKRTGYVVGETVARLELAREATRCGQHRLLASLVGCCHVDIARCTPRATLSALSALHLLIGMESDDEEYPSRSSIFSYPPARTLVDILSSLGLPEIILETSILCLDDFTTLTSSIPESIAQNLPAASHLKTLRTNRWSTHPLFTTDRYIRSSQPPVQFLPSPPPCSTFISAADDDYDSDYDPVTVLDSLPKALHDILENTAIALKQKFRKASNSENVIGRRRSGSSFVLMGPTVARECVELLRLMSISPLAGNDIQTSKKSNVTSSHGNGMANNDVIDTGYPIATSAISLSKLNSPIGHSLEQLLTAPMLFAMMTDAPLFLNSVCSPVPICRPIILWNPPMKVALSAVLKAENKAYLSALSAIYLDGLGAVVGGSSAEDDTTVPSSASKAEGPPLSEESTSEKSLSRSTLHNQLASECLVDNVYIRFLAHAPLLGPKIVSTERSKEDVKDDLGARDLARFLESLQTSISSSKRVIEHLTKASKSSQLGTLKVQLVLKETILSQMLADHDELGYGYSDLYLD